MVISFVLIADEEIASYKRDSNVTCVIMFSNSFLNAFVYVEISTSEHLKLFYSDTLARRPLHTQQQSLASQ